MSVNLVRKFRNDIVYRTFQILGRRDKVKISLVMIFQIFFGILDLTGVMLLGIIGSLAVAGVGGYPPGDRVSALIKFLNLDNYSLQYQVTMLGVFASVLLAIKSIASLVFIKKSIFFLSRRGALISQILLRKMLAQNLLKVNEKSMMQTINLLTNGVTALTVGIIGTLVGLFSDVSLLIILGFGLFIVDTSIAFMTLILFTLVSTLLYLYLQGRVRLLGKKQNDLGVEINEKISEVVYSFREIFVRNKRFFYSKNIGNLRLAYADAVAEGSFLPNLSKYAIELTLVLGCLIISGYQFSTQTASHAVAVLSIFLASSSRIAPAVLRVQQSFLVIKGNIALATPTLELIENLNGWEDINEEKNELNFKHQGFKPSVQISNVYFQYPNNSRMALKNVSMLINEGSSIAIVGPSGAGKSTLVDVILGLLPLKNGSCTISGVSPSEAINNWPGAIGYVPQTVVVYNSSIAKNVTMGFDLEEVDEKDIWNALDQAKLSDYVRNLPDSIHTSVGERGHKMSGGQRQRLGIARALFTKPNLLILDEATSSLDGITEAEITQSFMALKGKVTLVVIAHRLSTIKNCEKIVYMSDGEIKYIGSFEEVKLNVPEFMKSASIMGL